MASPAHKNKRTASHFLVFELQAFRLAARVVAFYFVYSIHKCVLTDGSGQIANDKETLLAVDGQQFNLKHQRGIWRYHAACAALAVGNRRRAGQLGFATSFHQLHALCPARDNTV